MLMQSTYLSDKVESYLGSKNYGDLLQDVVHDPSSLPHIQTEGMELITKLCENGMGFAEDNDSIEAITQCLNHVVRNYKPKEALICLLEQGEAFAHSDKFPCLLGPLQWVMLSLPKKREKTFSWVLSTLKSHLKYYLQVPEKLKSLSEEDVGETTLFEQDPNVQQILVTYKEYVSFYTPFVQQLEKIEINPNDIEILESVRRQKQYLRDYLVDLLGVPLIHFDLEWKDDDKKMKTDGRLMAEAIMMLLQVVDDSPLDYLQWIEDRMKGVEEKKMDKQRKEQVKVKVINLEEEDEEDDDEIIVHMSSLVTYLYLVIHQRIPVQRFRMVYSPTYMFNMIMYPVTTVLKNTNDFLALLKAIRLATAVIGLCSSQTIQENDEFNYFHRLHHSLITKEIHTLFTERLCYLAVYCTDKRVRDEAYTLFRRYLLCFDPQGRFDMIRYIFTTLPSDSLVGHMITLLKEFVHMASSPTSEPGMNECFLGPKAKRLVLSILRLKQGATTDLCQNSNHILASLNLLRYLLLRKTLLDISDVYPQIEESLLNPLRTALDLSKAHYELRLKELNDPHSKTDKENEEKRMLEKLECDIEIAGEQIKPGDISIQEQKRSAEHALVIFDHMNALMAWVQEAHRQFTNQ